MKIGEIKQNAKNYLKDNYWTVLGLCAIYVVVISVITFLQNKLSAIENIGNLLGVAIAIATVPLIYGFTKNLIDLKNGKTKNAIELFKNGYGNCPRAYSTWWSMSWRKFLKTLPGNIIMATGLIMFVVFMVVLITALAYDTQGLMEIYSDEMDINLEEIEGNLEYILSNTEVVTVLLVASFLFIVVGWLITLPFTLQYVIYDIIAVERQDLNAAQVAKESATLMKGNRINYIALQLSFIGWYILSILTCGIGFIFLLPYVQIARLSFYENIKGENGPVQETVVMQ